MAGFLVFIKNMATDIYGKPLAVPTPYISPQQGGNQYIVPGSQTQPVAQYSTPIQSLSSGGVKFSGGETVPSYNVIGSGSQTVPRTVQNVNLGANNTTLNSPPAPAPAPTQDSNGLSQQDVINAYKAMGWTDINAILADYAATGGSKIVGGGESGGQGLSDYMRGQIESGYNNYFNQLNELYGGLDTQAAAQNTIAQNSYNQSISDLLANKESSLSDLGLTEQKLQANQVKNLRDIASNIQNQYMAGNVMLGARGAGDSSAANQYSYALNRIGSKERGNVMNQTAQSQAEIDNNKAKLNNIVTQETSRLDTEFANVKQQISSWLAEQQNSIKQMIANGQLSKSQDIAAATTQALNMAITAYQNKATEIQNKRSQLESWALSNATKLSEVITNMQGVASLVPNMPSASAINGGVTVDSQGNLRSLFGYGNTDDTTNYYG